VLPLRWALLAQVVQQTRLRVYALPGLAVQWGLMKGMLVLWPVSRKHQHPWSAHIGYSSSPVREMASLMMVVLRKKHLSLSWLGLNFFIEFFSLSDSVT
jgi:hypothetical protein